MTLEDGNGGTLEFQPDGRAEFTVSAVYTDSTGKQSQFYFVVYYDGNNEVVTMLARFATGALKGSASDFLFKVNYFIDVDLAEKAFALDAEKYIYGLLPTITRMFSLSPFTAPDGLFCSRRLTAILT